MKAAALRRLAGSVRRGADLSDERREYAASALETLAAMVEGYVEDLAAVRDAVVRSGADDIKRALLLTQIRGAALAQTEDLRYRYLQEISKSLTADRAKGRAHAKKKSSTDQVKGILERHGGGGS